MTRSNYYCARSYFKVLLPLLVIFAQVNCQESPGINDTSTSGEPVSSTFPPVLPEEVDSEDRKDVRKQTKKFPGIESFLQGFAHQTLTYVNQMSTVPTTRIPLHHPPPSAWAGGSPPLGARRRPTTIPPIEIAGREDEDYQEAPPPPPVNTPKQRLKPQPLPTLVPPGVELTEEKRLALQYLSLLEQKGLGETQQVEETTVVPPPPRRRRRTTTREPRYTTPTDDYEYVEEEMVTTPPYQPPPPRNPATVSGQPLVGGYIPPAPAVTPAYIPPYPLAVPPLHQTQGQVVNPPPLPQQQLPLPPPNPAVPPANLNPTQLAQYQRLQQLKYLLMLQRLREQNQTTLSPYDRLAGIFINPQLAPEQITTSTADPVNPVHSWADLFGNLAVGNLGGVLESSVQIYSNGVFSGINQWAACNIMKMCQDGMTPIIGADDEPAITPPPPPKPLPITRKPYQDRYPGHGLLYKLKK